jgi:hypothetical protein
MRESTVERKGFPAWIGVACALAIIATLVVGCCMCVPISCDAWPFADAWLDADCDGLRGEDEEPLAGVCIWSPRSPDGPPFDPEYCTWDHGRTNDEGQWHGDLVSGCFTPYYIVAEPPRGFQPTTDTIVDSDMYAQFGFAPEGACPQRSIVTPESLVIQQRILLLIKGLVGGAVVAAFVFFYRKCRRGAVAGQDAPPAK